MSRVTQNRQPTIEQVPPADMSRLLAELRAEPYPRRSRWGSTARMEA